MISFSLSAVGILLVFYLYLLARPAGIKRSALFLIGAGGIVMALVGGFFAIWAPRMWANVLVGLFSTIGSLVAFGGAFLACYGGKLPLEIGGVDAEAASENTTEP